MKVFKQKHPRSLTRYEGVTQENQQCNSNNQAYQALYDAAQKMESDCFVADKSSAEIMSEFLTALAQIQITFRLRDSIAKPCALCCSREESLSPLGGQND